MANLLERLVAAYGPLYLRGLLLDGPGRFGAAQLREWVPGERGTPALSPATPPGRRTGTMPVPPARLEPGP